MRNLAALFLCLQMLQPMALYAQQITLKTPLGYSLQQYGVVIGLSLLGGLTSWIIKVRKGEVVAWNIATLIGELCISAFSGLIAFLLCEYFNLDPMLTPAIVGMAGHAGGKGITWLEDMGKQAVEKRLGLDSSGGNK